MSLYKKALCMAGAGLVLSCTHLLAAEKSALDIMNKAFQHTGSMDKYAFSAVIVDHDVQEDGSVVPYTYHTSVKVDRPWNLRVDTKSEFLNRSSYVHNGIYTIIDHGQEYYGQLTVPKNIDKALDSILKNYDIKAPLASLIYSDMAKRVKFKSGTYFGTRTVAGVECDYVAFKNKGKEIHVWITTGDIPRVKTYTITDTSKQPHTKKNTTITWPENSNISDNDFVFHAPKGSKKISVLNENQESYPLEDGLL